MTVKYISGGILDANLVRDGIDLSIETNLLYIDCTNDRIGINNATPLVALDVTGTLVVSGSGTIANITTSASAITASTGDLTLDATSGNISVSSKRIINCADPIGVLDAVNLQTLTSTVGAYALDTIISDDSSLTVIDDGIGAGSFDFVLDTASVATLSATTFNHTGAITASSIATTSGEIGSLNFGTNVISSDTASVEITGPLEVSDLAVDRGVFVDASGYLATDNKFSFDSTTGAMSITGSLAVDNLTLDGDTITADAAMNLITTSNGNLTFTTGTGIIDISSTAALQLPSGTTGERPSTGVAGMTRWNTTTSNFDYYDGATWNGMQASFNITSQQIIPDGSSVAYTLDKTATTDSVLISINGLIQDPESGLVYSVSGTTITFSSLPLVSDIISIRFLEA